MGVSVGLLFLFVLGVSWVCDARQLVTTDLSSRETMISDISVLLMIQHKSEREVQALEVVRNENLCTLCEEFASEALSYLAENKTQTEVIDILHKTCSQIPSFKQECMTMVDYYASLFFLEIASVQPGDLCQKVNLCNQMVVTSPPLFEDSCGLCHHAVAEVLSKLKDPDTQLEILEMLLKGCDAVEGYVKKCKRMVFEYGPLILANAEQFLETRDICIVLHACDSPIAGNQSSLTVKTL